MSRRDPNAVTDGITRILRGVNSGLAPVSLGRDQLAWAVNCTTRGQYVTNRPGFVKRTLRFLDADGAQDTTLTDNFQEGIFQGAIAFERRGQIVTMIGGRLFRIKLDAWDVMDVSITGDLNPSNRYRAWFCEAEDFIIAQDGQSAPLIYDGASTRRSDTFGAGGAKMVPTGTSMVYSNGRLLVALQDNRQFVVGDIVNGDSGTASYNYADSILYFTENDVINGGGAFSVPINAGELTAFRPVAQVDTSTGQGPTQVFTTGGIFSLNAPTAREAWADTNFPIGTVSMVSAGSLSDRATVNVNGDIWMRSLDGLRSFIVGRRDMTTWVNAPMSQEVNRALARDDRNLLGHASGALFDNRLLMTVNPYRVWDHGICHRGLVVLDFAPLAYLNTRVPPVWEGLWTGLQVLQIITGTFNGVERCFVFALNSQDEIELWELTKTRTSDSDGTTDIPIEWSVETCAFNFPRGVNANPLIPGGELQKLGNGLLYVDNIRETVLFTTQYRPDQDPCWHDWHEWDVCATTSTCGIQGSRTCVTPQNLHAQYRKPFRLPAPAATCSSAVGKPVNVGAEFQGKLTVTGSCRILRWEFIAYDQQEDVTGLCAPSESCQTVACCADTDYSYEIV
jgi:hypothetical protein